MKFAIPTANNMLCQHFGHCEVFTFIEIDENTKQIIKTETIEPPEHQPGIIPPWVAKQGANIVIAGGMGAKAIKLFEESGIKVIIGSEINEPSLLVISYLNNTLKTGINACDH